MTAHAGTAEAVPSSDEPEARILDHAYDGIREYDNPLPSWWSAIFWATIAFSVAYVLAMHVFDIMRSPHARYRAALATYEDQRGARERAESANVSEQLLAQRAMDSHTVASGHAIFKARCASCHTEDGRGLIGPNLTDHFQLHGESRLDIYNVIKRGVPGTAMLAWGEQLGPNDVIAVAAYATTLRGLDLAGKAREGTPVKPFVP